MHGVNVRESRKGQKLPVLNLSRMHAATVAVGPSHDDALSRQRGFVRPAPTVIKEIE